MRMKNIFLTTAITAAMISSFSVQAGTGPIVYGKLHATVDHVDFDGATGDYWQVESRGSRLGIKGSEDLGNGLSAIYKMEFGVDIDGTVNTLSTRNQYVGLSDKRWGTFLLGNHNTSAKVMTNKDIFDDRIADWNEVGFTGGSGAIAEDNRVANAIMYTTPTFNNFTFSAMVTPGETDEDDEINGNITSIAGKYSNGPLYVGLAYEESEFQGDDSANPTRDDQEKWRIFASYKIGDFMVGGMYQDIEGDGNLQDVDADVWRINGTYTFGNNELKIAYQAGEVDDDRTASAAYDSPEYDTFTIGLDHRLSKRTELYAIYTQTDTNGDAKNAASLGAGTDDWDAISFGMVHDF